jgi:hypothetical protein
MLIIIIIIITVTCCELCIMHVPYGTGSSSTQTPDHVATLWKSNPTLAVLVELTAPGRYHTQVAALLTCQTVCTELASCIPHTLYMQCFM